MNKINLQSGRSMIEMLGVLAIIGVLSVGGIAGYSKAMFRYKINKTIEQITYIAGNVRTTFASQGDYKGLSFNCPDNSCIAKKAKLLPDDMWKEGQSSPRNVWDGMVDKDLVRKRSGGASSKAFIIIYFDIPEEACIELITQDWNNAQVKALEANRQMFVPPVKIDDAVKTCSDNAALAFYFDIDTSDSYWKDKIDATTAALAGS